jgi:hypothetical protein
MTKAATWQTLPNGTTIAALFAWLAGRFLDRTPSAAVLRRNERAYTGSSAVGRWQPSPGAHQNRYASTKLEWWKNV